MVSEQASGLARALAPDSEFQNLCFHMGLTLAVWQRVEDAHFRLFHKLIGAPNSDLSSIVYHSTESLRRDAQ